MIPKYKMNICKKYNQYRSKGWSIRKMLSREIRLFITHFLWKARYYFKIKQYGLNKIKDYGNLNYQKLSTNEIISAAKHEAHRIEKAYYAGYLNTNKYSVYDSSRKNINEMLNELKTRDIDFQRADVKWIEDMHNAFFNLSEYIEKRKTSVNKFDLNKLIKYQEFVSNRRSTENGPN